jgi:hypothetical protein
MKYNVYYEEGTTDGPIVLFGHGSGGNRGGYKTSAQGVGQSGMLGVTFDARGQGDGATDNAASPELGLRTNTARQVADALEIVGAVIENFSAVVDPTKMGVAGQSQGGTLCWTMMSCSGPNAIPPSVRALTDKTCPRVLAISPIAMGPNQYQTVLVDGRGIADPAFNIFDDVSHMRKPSYQTAARVAIKGGVDIFEQFLRGDDPDAEHLEFPYRTFSRLGSNYHTNILLFRDWDDNWASANRCTEFASRYNGRGGDHGSGEHTVPKCVVSLGAFGSHQSPEVTAEVADLDAKRLAFFKEMLLDDASGIAAAFGPGTPATFADAGEVQYSLIPNNDADYVLADSHTDPYARVTGYVNSALFFEEATNPDENANATTFWLDTSDALATSAPGSPYTADITQTWSSDTTLSDYCDAAGAGTALYTYISTRVNSDDNDFDIAWNGAHEELLVGNPRVVLYASSSLAETVLNVELRYIESGTGDGNYVSSAYVRFPKEYTPGQVHRFDIDMDTTGMHLDANSSALLRIRVNNIPHKSSPYDSYVGGMRIHPCFEDFTSTIYFGSTYPSRVTLPLHDDTLTTLDA